MRQLNEYYMAQTTKTEDFGFKVIIRSPLVFHYPEEEKFDVVPETLSRCSNVDAVDYVSTLHAWYYN